MIQHRQTKNIILLKEASPQSNCIKCPKQKSLKEESSAGAGEMARQKDGN